MIKVELSISLYHAWNFLYPLTGGQNGTFMTQQPRKRHVQLLLLWHNLFSAMFPKSPASLLCKHTDFSFLSFFYFTLLTFCILWSTYNFIFAVRKLIVIQHHLSVRFTLRISNLCLLFLGTLSLPTKAMLKPSPECPTISYCKKETSSVSHEWPLGHNDTRQIKGNLLSARKPKRCSLVLFTSCLRELVAISHQHKNVGKKVLKSEIKEQLLISMSVFHIISPAESGDA